MQIYSFSERFLDFAVTDGAGEGCMQWRHEFIYLFEVVTSP